MVNNNNNDNNRDLVRLCNPQLNADIPVIGLIVLFNQEFICDLLTRFEL